MKPSGPWRSAQRASSAFTRITLRPRIVFSVEHSASAEQLSSLHHAAHDECFIANSLKCEVVVEAA